MSVDVDGQAVGNVSEATIANWGYDDKPQYAFSITSYEKIGGVNRITRLMANVKDRPAAAKASTKFPGLIEEDVTQRVKEETIASLLQRYRTKV